ncbi:MAG TPA: aminopeptidase P family protein [Candidatus Paceibacterota bacterium]|nr:aminopeptidase P family protein [Candidatus Paceibacterota bacterium]
MDEVINNRIKRALDIVREEDADALLVFNHELSGQPGTRYLSGFSGTESVLLVAEGGRFIFTDGRYFSRVKEECQGFKLVPAGGASFWEEFKKISGRLSLKKIIFDSARTSYGQISRLNEKIEGISAVGIDNVLQKIRIIKDETELAKIKKAVSISAKSFKELMPFIKEGITENELAWKLEMLMRENGAEKISFELIVASGPNGAKPHAKASDRKIRKGELITLDFGCCFDGYASDVTRTVALGPVSGKLSEIYETVKTAQELGCKAVKAGIAGMEIDKICRDYISGKPARRSLGAGGGYSEYFLHGTGHGVGMEVHELPHVSGGNKEPLPENSVITVEPGIYIEGLGGVRIEDTIVVKKGGGVNLSGELLPKELIVL